MTTTSPTLHAIRTLLSDATWHTEDEILRAVQATIPPEIAARRYIRAQDTRAQQAQRTNNRTAGNKTPATDLLSESFTARLTTGKRIYIRQRLHSLGAERRGGRGDSSYRLLPHPPQEKRTRQEVSTAQRVLDWFLARGPAGAYWGECLTALVAEGHHRSTVSARMSDLIRSGGLLPSGPAHWHAAPTLTTDWWSTHQRNP